MFRPKYLFSDSIIVGPNSNIISRPSLFQDCYSFSVRYLYQLDDIVCEYMRNNPHECFLKADVDLYGHLRYTLSIKKNSNLFKKLNTTKMRKNCQNFAKELAEYVFNPLRLQKMAALYEIDMCDYLEKI